MDKKESVALLVEALGKADSPTPRDSPSSAASAPASRAGSRVAMPEEWPAVGKKLMAERRRRGPLGGRRPRGAVRRQGGVRHPPRDRRRGRQGVPGHPPRRAGGPGPGERRRALPPCCSASSARGSCAPRRSGRSRPTTIRRLRKSSSGSTPCSTRPTSGPSSRPLVAPGLRHGAARRRRGEDGARGRRVRRRGAPARLAQRQGVDETHRRGVGRRPHDAGRARRADPQDRRRAATAREGCGRRTTSAGRCSTRRASSATRCSAPAGRSGRTSPGRTAPASTTSSKTSSTPARSSRRNTPCRSSR